MCECVCADYWTLNAAQWQHLKAVATACCLLLQREVCGQHKYIIVSQLLPLQSYELPIWSGNIYVLTIYNTYIVNAAIMNI